MSMMRNTIRTQARASLRPQIIQTEPEKEQPKALTGLDALDTVELSDTVVKLLPFKCTCGIKNNSVAFFAQLKGGKSFGANPVMPKDEYGNPLMPDNVVNSKTGYLVVEVSANAKIAVYEGGRMEFTLRPTFVAFEPELEAAKAAEAAETAKIAEEAKKAAKASK